MIPLPTKSVHYRQQYGRLRHLDAFSAARRLVCCGGGLPGRAKAFGGLPIRAFHGLRDQTVDLIESLQMVKAVNLAGGHAEPILFPELSHNCWDTVYTDEKNYDWLLSFTSEKNRTLAGELSKKH